jgi:hypothetical protein
MGKTSDASGGMEIGDGRSMIAKKNTYMTRKACEKFPQDSGALFTFGSVISAHVRQVMGRAFLPHPASRFHTPPDHATLTPHLFGEWPCLTLSGMYCKHQKARCKPNSGAQGPHCYFSPDER